MKKSTQGPDAQELRKQWVTFTEKVTPREIREYMVLRRSGDNDTLALMLGRSAGARNGSKNRNDATLKTGAKMTLSLTYGHLMAVPWPSHGRFIPCSWPARRKLVTISRPFAISSRPRVSSHSRRRVNM